MKEELAVLLIQFDITWEQPSENKKRLDAEFEALDTSYDLIVLPEMFSTGFTMTPEKHAETMQGPTLVWLQQWSQTLQSAICGSLIIKEAAAYYNRFVFVTPEGAISTYDKRHLFHMAGEGKRYTAGDKKPLIQYQGWRILPQICYDLRFPVFSRNTSDYDAIIYVANWPETRIAAWDTLLQARAIENMAYVIGVNRIGLDGNQLAYIGHSATYDVLGARVSQELAADASQANTVKTVQRYSAILDKKHITTLRSNLPFLEDRDAFELIDL